MSPLLNACKTLGFCGLAAGLFFTATAQEITPTGGETSASGALPGDQVYPSASVGPGGGYLVWQDSKADGRNKGQGVVAMRLSEQLQPTGEPFVISQKPLGHQETPDVAMLTNGGAAFTWLGPKHQSPDVFARFVNSDGTFLTGDIQVNPLASRLLKTNRTVRMMGYKANKLRSLTFRVQDSSRIFRDRNHTPSAIGLPDGGALITYSGWRRLHTNWTEIVTVERYLRGRYYTNDLPQKFSASQDWMLDVFFQRFDAQGRKVGSEVLVNNFARYNQHQPSVALLPNGTFVVVWVSETFVDSFHRNFNVYAGSPLLLAQIDIVGRLFGTDGTPLSGEFTINTAVRNCSSPTVSAMSDGSFTVAWSQRDGVRTNGWDIYARSFDVNGIADGDAVRMNEHTYGDQFAPTIASAGANQLLAWTTLGQEKAGNSVARFPQRDGSILEVNLGKPASVRAVYGRLLNGGQPVGTEFRINSTLTGKPMQPALVSDGVNHIGALWSGFTPSTSSFDVFHQLYTTPFSPQATNAVDGGLVLRPQPGAGQNGAEFRVSVANSREKVVLNWVAEAGLEYQIQVSTNLVNWSNVGATRTAGGENETVTLPIGTGIGFYRVVKLR